MDRPERLRLRVENFELLEANGAFVDYGKAELIDGDIYVTNAQFARHGRAKVRMLAALFNWVEANRPELDVFSEVSIRIAADSMPEPDLFLARRQEYGPVPVESAFLSIEVSDTLVTDLGRKAQLYAPAGVPEYWVVDLSSNHVLVHYRPEQDGYGERRQVAIGEHLVAVTIDGLAVDTGKLIA